MCQVTEVQTPFPTKRSAGQMRRRGTSLVREKSEGVDGRESLELVSSRTLRLGQLIGIVTVAEPAFPAGKRF